MTATHMLNEVCDVLDTYKGRDKVLRTLCYSTRLIGCMTKCDVLKKKLNKFASVMSKTRTTLRLFDDLPMLRYNLEYGLGENEPDKLMQTIGVTSNIIDTIFYPIEKVSWLSEYEIIERDGTPWDIASTVCWVSTCYLSLIKTLRHYSILNQLKETSADKLTQRKISIEQKMTIITLIRLILDCIQSVHCLPAGFLWSSQLKPWQNGLVGTLSSLIGLYQIFAKRALAKAD